MGVTLGSKAVVNYVITILVARCKLGTENVHPDPVTRGKACSR